MPDRQPYPTMTRTTYVVKLCRDDTGKAVCAACAAGHDPAWNPTKEHFAVIWQGERAPRVALKCDWCHRSRIPIRLTVGPHEVK